MNKFKITLIVFVLISLTGNILLGIKYSNSQRDLEEAEQSLETQQMNEKVLRFSKLFIGKVLKAEEEIGFEERLNLENAVRGLDDEAILTQWNKFVESKDEIEAQIEVKNLLELLVSKIYPVK